MRVSFDIDGLEDVQDAINVLMNLEDVYRIFDGDLVAVKPEQVKEGEASDLVELAMNYRALKGASSKVEPPAPTSKPVEPAKAKPMVIAAAPKPVPAKNGAGAITPRDVLRAIAIEKGTRWIIPHLENHKVTRLRDLSDTQVVELIRAVPASDLTREQVDALSLVMPELTDAEITERLRDRA